MRRREFLQKTSLALMGLAIAPRIAYGIDQQSSFPFTDLSGKPLITPSTFPSLDDRVFDATAGTLSAAKRLHDDEFAAVEANLAARKNRLSPYLERFSPKGTWHHPHLEDANKGPLRLRTNKLTKDEESLLHDVEFFGRELANPQNAYRYDPTWTKSLREKYSLRPTDCTHYALEAYTRATADETLLHEYMDKAYKARTFPWVFSMRLKNDYETIMVIPNSRSEQRYFNGSTNGWSNRQVIENIKNGWYYTSTDYSAVPSWFRERFLAEQGIVRDDKVIDYYVLDEQAKTASFKTFLERNRGIAIKQEFVHVHLFDGDDLYEADWGNNPLYANVFEKTSLYERLHSDGEDKIHNIILWVPRGSVQAHLWRAQQESWFIPDFLRTREPVTPRMGDYPQKKLMR